MFDILEGALAGVGADTIIPSCRINNENITIRNMLTHICPIALMDGSSVGRVLEELEGGKDPGFLARALLPLIFMNPRDLDRFLKTFNFTLLPKGNETEELLYSVIAMVFSGNRDINIIIDAALKRNKWRSQLSSCGVHNITVVCTDQTMDFCESGQMSSAIAVLVAIFLPGLVHALANITFYKVGKIHMIILFILNVPGKKNTSWFWDGSDAQDQESSKAVQGSPCAGFSTLPSVHDGGGAGPSHAQVNIFFSLNFVNHEKPTHKYKP